MSLFQKVSTVIRNAWLASIGAFSVGKNKTTETIAEMTDKSEHFIDELIVEGASLESELSEKLKLRDRLDRRISALNNALGRRNVVIDDKLILMSDKVDQLTIVVNQLLAKKIAAKKIIKKPRKTAAKKITPKPAKVNADLSAAQVSG